jgi:hypothetical protein
MARKLARVYMRAGAVPYSSIYCTVLILRYSYGGIGLRAHRCMEGFTHLIPHAAGQEVIRQDIRELTLIRITTDIIYDQMIERGCARKSMFSMGSASGSWITSPARPLVTPSL